MSDDDSARGRIARMVSFHSSCRCVMKGHGSLGSSGISLAWIATSQATELSMDCGQLSSQLLVLGDELPEFVRQQLDPLLLSR